MYSKNIRYLLDGEYEKKYKVIDNFSQMIDANFNTIKELSLFVFEFRLATSKCKLSIDYGFSVFKINESKHLDDPSQLLLFEQNTDYSDFWCFALLEDLFIMSPDGIGKNEIMNLSYLIKSINIGGRSKLPPSEIRRRILEKFDIYYGIWERNKFYYHESMGKIINLMDIYLNLISPEQINELAPYGLLSSMPDYTATLISSFKYITRILLDSYNIPKEIIKIIDSYNYSTGVAERVQKQEEIPYFISYQVMVFDENSKKFKFDTILADNTWNINDLTKKIQTINRTQVILEPIKNVKITDFNVYCDAYKIYEIYINKSLYDNANINFNILNNI